ncbi:MAG: alpha-glucan family phosphorylase [Actinomycetota bacterium]|nr:alpha-glucan family phosphorylase [Actinomycetota bacterium]
MGRDGAEDVARSVAELAARIPDQLAPLARLAFNYRWSWTPGGPERFRRIDPDRFALTHENPVRLLLEASTRTLEECAEDRDLVQHAGRLAAELDAELARPPEDDVVGEDRPVAFFCAEFGIHESLPIYSGGLGVLAGDILKEASDRRIPFVGVGLMYANGQFHQRLDPGGWQHDYWIPSDPDRLPVALVTGDDGQPLAISLPIRGRDVVAQVWRVDVGRVPLFLLDANRPENGILDRWITSRLYVGDRTTRLAQYALLGIGGVRALRAMGIEAGVVHVNEGHAAFAALELIRELATAGHGFEEAVEETRRRIVFTTHTPVAAGNESYRLDEVDTVLGKLFAEMGPEREQLLGLGRIRADDPGDALGTTVLGLRAGRSANAVSRRHGEVARSMWQPLYPGTSEADVPIGHVTNGVHLPTWMAPAMRGLLDRHLGRDWAENPGDPRTWERVEDIPDEELWETRCRLRTDLVRWLRERAVMDRLAREEPSSYVEAAIEAFDPDALTLGFARRVAAYKRLDLLIREPERVVRLLSGPESVQVVLAGKAHPQDDEAKGKLQLLFEMKWSAEVGSRVAYVEDYDMAVATHLVSGCDVWINLPRPPLEASGTSGMKAALNGALNLSILDGWWMEAYDGTNGWGIDGSEPADPELEDERDAAAFYDLAEKEVIPLFFDRDEHGVPRGWVQRMKASLRTVGSQFTATRMVRDYLAGPYRTD